MNFDKTLSILLKFGIALVAVGILLYLLHLPFNHQIITTGWIVLVSTYMIRFFRKQTKVLADFIKLLLVISMALNNLHAVFHFFYPWLLRWIPLASLILLYFITDMQRVKDFFKDFPLVKSIFLVAFLSCYLIGILIKIMHWPVADQLLILGTALFIMTLFIPQRPSKSAKSY